LSVVGVGKLPRRSVELDLAQSGNGQIIGPHSAGASRNASPRRGVEEERIENKGKRTHGENGSRDERHDCGVHSSSRTAAASRASSSSVASARTGTRGDEIGATGLGLRHPRSSTTTTAAPPPNARNGATQPNRLNP